MAAATDRSRLILGDGVNGPAVTDVGPHRIVVLIRGGGGVALGRTDKADRRSRRPVGQPDGSEGERCRPRHRVAGRIDARQFVGHAGCSQEAGRPIQNILTRGDDDRASRPVATGD